MPSTTSTTTSTTDDMTRGLSVPGRLRLAAEIVQGIPRLPAGEREAAVELALALLGSAYLELEGARVLLREGPLATRGPGVVSFARPRP